MKKFLFTLGLSCAVASASAASLSMSLTNGQCSTFTGLNPGPVTIQQVIVQYTNAANVQFYDCGTNGPAVGLSYTNLAYTNTQTYATNVTNANTNYYGVTNYFTNIALIDNTNNAMPATTNTFPLRLQVGCTNGTTIADHVNYYFLNGLILSNSSTGAANLAAVNVTITYTQ